MKKYCLQLMGIDTYVREKKKLPRIIEDIQAFAGVQGVRIVVSQSSIGLRDMQFSFSKLNTKEGKQRLYDMIMEECNVEKL